MHKVQKNLVQPESMSILRGKCRTTTKVINPYHSVMKARMMAGRWDFLYDECGNLIYTKRELAKLLYRIWRKYDSR